MNPVNQHISKTEEGALKPAQGSSLCSRFLNAPFHLLPLESLLLGIPLASIPMIASEFLKEIIKEQCQRTWTPINYAQCLLLLATNVFACHSILKEGFDREYINHTYLDREKNLKDKRVTLVVDADHTFRQSTSHFSSRKRSLFDMINSVSPVFFKKIKGIDDIEEEQNKLLEKGNVIKYLFIDSHSNQNLVGLGDKDIEFVGTQNFMRPNNELTPIDQIKFLSLSDELTISKRFELANDLKKFNAYRQEIIDQRGKNRIPNDEKLRKIFKKLDKDAKIIICGCEAGKGNSNIAQHIANLAEGREVTASTTFIHGTSLDIKIDAESTNPKLTARFKSLNFGEAVLLSSIFYQVFGFFSVFSSFKLTPYIGWDVTKVTRGQPEAIKDSTYFEKFKNYYKSSLFPLPFA